MYKTITGNDTTKAVGYKAEVKENKAPEIIEKYQNDNLETVYVLDNGRETLQSKYDQIWNPAKTKIMPVNYKRENKDKTKVA